MTPGVPAPEPGHDGDGAGGVHGYPVPALRTLAPAPTDPEAVALAAVVEELRAHEVLARTRELAVRWAHDAAAELAPLPDGSVKEALEDFAAALADRAA